MAAAPGLCPTCSASGHKHLLGETCATCGHNADQRDFQAVKKRGPTSSSLHFEAFDTGTCAADAFKAAFAYAKIMRERIFVNELQHVESKEEFDEADQSSRHVYGMIGDAPIAYMRWRVLTEPTGQVVAIERVLVLNTHRRRGIGRQLVAFALQDIIQKVAQLQLNIAAIVAHLPNVPHLTRMFEAFNFRPVSGTFRERGVAVARFALLPADVTKGVAAIAAINAHAPQFGTGTGVVDGPAVAAAAAPAMAPPGSS